MLVMYQDRWEDRLEEISREVLFLRFYAVEMGGGNYREEEIIERRYFGNEKI